MSLLSQSFDSKCCNNELVFLGHNDWSSCSYSQILIPSSWKSLDPQAHVTRGPISLPKLPVLVLYGSLIDQSHDPRHHAVVVNHSELPNWMMSASALVISRLDEAGFDCTFWIRVTTATIVIKTL